MPAPPSPDLLVNDPFARDAFATAALAALALSTLGVWIIFWRTAFFAHAAASLSFPAAVAAIALGLPVGPIAAALGVTYGVVVGALMPPTGRAATASFPDGLTALAVVAAFAGGVVLAGSVGGSGAAIDALLFGSVLAGSSGDRLALACVALVAAVLHLGLGRALLALAFDPVAARSFGLPVRTLRVAALSATAAAVAAAIPALGALLAPALATLPAATARIVRDRVAGLTPLAVVIALACSALGTYVAFWFDLPPGPTIALASVLAYASAVVYRALHATPKPARRVVSAMPRG